MAINSILTNDGVGRTIIAMNEEGFFIKLKKFSVSETAGTLDKTKTDVDKNPEWYEALISSGQKIDDNTIEVICNIPPGVVDLITGLPVSGTKYVREIYITAEDQLANEFLLAIGQPDPEAIYIDSGALTFRLQISILNVDVNAVYQFAYTQAAEISDHNIDPLAHPPLQDAMNDAGIYVQQFQHKFSGQTFDRFPAVNASVGDKEAVYFDTGAAEYDEALADGSDAQQAVGMYLADEEKVVFNGIIDYPHAWQPYTNLFLSTTNAGEISTTGSPTWMGYALPNNKIFLDVKNLIEFSRIAGGGGGAGSFIPTLGVPGPTEDVIDGIELLGFDYNSSQEIFFNYKLPSSFNGGAQLYLSGGLFYSDTIVGKVLFRAQTTLLKKGAHILGTYPYMYTSTNLEVDAPVVANTQKQIGSLALTDSNGQIGGQVLEAGDVLRIRVYRDPSGESVSMAGLALVVKNSFEPTASL